MATTRAFGKYRLLGRIAQGGMAEVILAQAPGASGFSKLVTVKRILSQYSANEDFIQMFIDEAKIAASLNHPNIVHIYDLGKVNDQYYIAMEYIEGQDLWSVLRMARKRNKPLGIANAVYIIIQACKGLYYAHSFKDSKGTPLGIVHRDISPNNVLISYNGDIKIVDFGIAKAEGKLSETKAGIIKGKFAYLSPEQALARPLDGRSDLFALGIVLWEALTGERLFDAEDDLATLRLVQDAIIKPLASGGQEYPEDLEAIVKKALAREVKDRYQGCDELQSALQKFLNTHYPEYTDLDLKRYLHDLFAKEISVLEAKIRQLVEEMETELGDAEAEPAPGVEEVEDEEILEPDDDMEEELQPQTKDRLPSAQLKVSFPASEAGVPPAPVGARHEKISVAAPVVRMPSAAEMPAADTPDDDPAVLAAGGRPRRQFGHETRGAPASRKIQVAVAAAAVAAVAAVAVLSHEKAPEVKTGMLHVQSNVDGIEVLVDGIAVKPAEPNRYGPFAAGKAYNIEVRRNGFSPNAKRVEIKPDDVTFFAATLTPLRATLIVTTDPPDAAVMIDNRTVGKTPLTMENVQPGVVFTLKVAKQGYKGEEEVVTLDSGSSVTKSYTLEKAAKPKTGGGHGYIKVSVSPGWADVYLNKVKIGTTPFKNPVKVPAGKVKLVLKNPVAGKEKVVTVEVEEGATQKLPLEW